jgi:phosphate-selective porin OprO and OprP
LNQAFSSFHNAVLVRLGVLLALLYGLPVQGDDTASGFDRLWRYATLYENAGNPVVQKFALSGRLQADGVNFEADQGNHQDVRWRRFRFGFTSAVAREFVVRVEADLDLNEKSEYQRLTDSYISWSPSGNWKLTALKHSAGFTLDGATSSTKLLTPERNNLTNNIWFDVEYFTGLSIQGEADGWIYRAGVYASDEDKQLSDFNSGEFGLFSLGHDWAQALNYKTALLRLDYVYNDEHQDAATPDLEQVASLVSEWEQGRWGLRTDLSGALGYADQSDLWGLVMMPYYSVREKIQLVFRYTYMHSEDPNGIRPLRYESDISSARGDEYTEFYAGFNVFFYQHKLKWQTGLSFANLKDKSNQGGPYDDGWGLTTALRIYW